MGGGRGGDELYREVGKREGRKGAAGCSTHAVRGDGETRAVENLILKEEGFFYRIYESVNIVIIFCGGRIMWVMSVLVIALLVVAVVNYCPVLEQYNASLITASVSIIGSFLVTYIRLESEEKRWKKDFEKDKQKLEAEIRSKHSKTYKMLITAERIKWLNNIRDEMCQMLTQAYGLAMNTVESIDNIDNKETDLKYAELITEINMHAIKINLMINPNDESDEELKQKILSFVEEIVSLSREGVTRGYNEKIREIEKECQKFIKKEWTVIKDEAKWLFGGVE